MSSPVVFKVQSSMNPMNASFHEILHCVQSFLATINFLREVQNIFDIGIVLCIHKGQQTGNNLDELLVQCRKFMSDHVQKNLHCMPTK